MDHSVRKLTPYRVISIALLIIIAIFSALQFRLAKE